MDRSRDDRPAQEDGQSGAAVAQPSEAFEVRTRDGAAISVRIYGYRQGPRLVVSHGNGLAIDGYASFWQLLAEECEVVVFDMRNHGRSPPHDQAAHCWPNFPLDLEAVWQSLRARPGRGPTIGIFHSLSAITSLMQVLDYGPRWDGLLLVDPPLFPRDGSPLQAAEFDHMNDMVRRSARRTQRFASPAVMAAQLARRPEFRRWRPEAYRQMATALLRRDAKHGDWVLRCPRELEARVFATNTDATIWPRLPLLRTPLMILGADPSLPERTLPALICQALTQELDIPYRMLPGTTHFLQIERPVECAAVVREFCRSLSP